MANDRVALVPRDLTFPTARVLDSGVLEAYEEFLDSKGYEGRAREVSSIYSNSKGESAGSNCFGQIAVREVLPEGTRLATMGDYGLAVENDPNFTRGNYGDTGVCLFTPGDSYQPNDLLAKRLARQLKKRGITLDSPKVIYFDGLKLRKNRNSAYGLVYDLSENAKLGREIVDAQEAVVGNNGKKFSRFNETGMPIFNKEGDKTFFTRGEGLVRFGFGVSQDVGSGTRGLAGSGSDGRVVVVDAAGVVTPQASRHRI